MFSIGVSNALAILDAQGGTDGASHFPNQRAVSAEFRITDGEPISKWFERCVDGAMGRDVGPCEIETNIALLASIRRSGGHVRKACIQVLVNANGSLADVYLGDPKADARYYRLDLDVDSPGRLFREPQPHVHCTPAQEPRFPWQSLATGSAVLDFIEFIYLNHAYDRWVAFARESYDEDRRQRHLDSNFEALQEAYDAGMVASAAGIYREDVNRLRDLLTAAKRDCCPALNMDASIRWVSY